MSRRKKSYFTSNSRILFVNVIFGIVSLIFIARLFQIQVLDHKKYNALAQEQYWDLQEIPAKRGNILSSDGYPLATTQVSYLLYGEPKRIANRFEVTEKLSEVLSKFNKYEFDDPQTFYTDKIYKLLGEDLYWVKLHGELSPDEKVEIENLGIEGLGFEEEPKRYYPESTLSSHVLGFVAHDEKGESQGYFGIEGGFDGVLKGRSGRIIEEQDAFGAPILVGGYKRVDPTNGSNVVLTINRAVQYIIERRLKEGVEEYDAVSGSVIVMDPFTGDVVAMANYPTYDPANFNDFDDDPDEEKAENERRRKNVERTNLAISQTYEPGSVMKAFTISSAIDLGKVSPSTTFVDGGPVQYSDYVIDNWDGNHHGTQTIIQLLQKSNNIGAAWVGHQVGSKNLSEYLQNFGMGSILGIELEGEDTGIIRDNNIWTDIDLATIAFGQGISATPLQVLNGFNAIANGGNLMRPRIVTKIEEDEKTLEIKPKILRRVISEGTSDTMINLLTLAVEGGESEYFNIKGYSVAGKTGTAQIPEGGKYNPSKTNATFVGFLPNNMKYTMIVKLEEPSSSIYAAETSVPLWMKITEDLVKYYGIPPDKIE